MLIVPVALATSTAPKVPVIGVPKPGPVVTASSTTSSAWVTVDPPVVASLRSAVTVTGDLASEGLGDRVTCVDTGPTPSVLGGGAAVSRKVSMPPKANDSGSAVDCPLLSRWPAASYSAIFASGPVGIGREGVGRGPGLDGQRDRRLGVPQGVAVAGHLGLVAAQQAHGVRLRADVDVAQQHAGGPGRC